MRTPLLALSLALSASACNADDPLDPDLLQRVARLTGDASGTALSGVYPMPAATPRRCECAELDTAVLEQLFESPPASATCGNLAAWIFLKQIRLEIRHYDGFMLETDGVPGGILVFTGARLNLTGAVYEDDTAELASVTYISGDELQLLARVQLTFDETPGAPRSASGLLRSRIVSRVADANIDCEIDFDLEGVADLEERLP